MNQPTWDYELWTTSKWIEFVQNLPNNEKALEVINHIIGTQYGWLKRITDSTKDFTVPELTNNPQKDLESMVAAWQEFTNERNLDKVVHFSGKDGEEFSCSIIRIQSHVLNHGAYHRGQLRQICDEMGWDDFPETDFIYYLWKTDQL